MKKSFDQKVLKDHGTITKCIFKGLTNLQIAKQLNYSRSTVGAKINSLFSEYNVKNRNEFIIKVAKQIIQKKDKEILSLYEQIDELNSLLKQINKKEPEIRLKY